MKGNGVPSVVTYNPNFKNLSFLIRKNLQFLDADPETKRVFTPAPLVSFRSLQLKKLLSKIYSLSTREESRFRKM